jgi:lysophospholipase L1-like esterase
MKRSTSPITPCAFGLLAAIMVGLAGCGDSTTDGTPSATPPQPNEAASQLQQAFTSAAPEVRNTANAASEALRTADYEKAIQSIQTIKARQNLTFDQGLAVYNTERALEASLVMGVNAGDPNAKRAYELLKKSRRN